MHCNALQRTATHCNTLQRAVTHCNTMQHTATHCNALQRTETHCNALQRTATHCNERQRTATHYSQQTLYGPRRSTPCRVPCLHCVGTLCVATPAPGLSLAQCTRSSLFISSRKSRTMFYSFLLLACTVSSSLL